MVRCAGVRAPSESSCTEAAVGTVVCAAAVSPIEGSYMYDGGLTQNMTTYQTYR